MKNDNKREKMEEEIKIFISSIMNLAEKQNKLENLEIKISSNDGDLCMDYKLS